MIYLVSARSTLRRPWCLLLRQRQSQQVRHCGVTVLTPRGFSSRLRQRNRRQALVSQCCIPQGKGFRGHNIKVRLAKLWRRSFPFLSLPDTASAQAIRFVLGIDVRSRWVQNYGSSTSSQEGSSRQRALQDLIAASPQGIRRTSSCFRRTFDGLG